MPKVTIKDLVDAGVHFGHQTKRWNPKMKPYIFGVRNNINIIDLTITMKKLLEACRFLNKVILDGGEILVVGTKRQAQEEVRELAEKTGIYYMHNRWLGGSLTNFKTIRNSIKKMVDIRTSFETEEYKKMSKKEQSSLTREFKKLEKNLAGIETMKKMPAVMLVVDIEKEHNAVKEANKLNIPIVAIVDTNSDPTLVDYVIPANDDAVRSIRVLLSVIGEAIVASNVEMAKVSEAKAQKQKEKEEALAKQRTEKAEAVKKEKEAKANSDKKPKTDTTKKTVAKKEAHKKKEAPKIENSDKA